MEHFLGDQNISLFSNEKIIANYKIISELGRGGMGIVYKALQVSPKREVAIKVILRKESQNSIKRFEREMQLTGSLDHCYIARVYDFIYDNNLFYLVMEYIPGIPLDEYLNKNDISLSAKIQLFKKICLALSYAHQHNIIHRDLKPENILVLNGEIPKIIDFGLARRMGTRFDLTKSGEVLGTPRYMAPEQVVGKSVNIDHQSDIYALGVILFEMLVGKQMIEGHSLINIFHNIQYEKITSPSKLNKSVPKGIDTIWAMAVARDKQKRYQDLQDLINDLDLFVNGDIITRSIGKTFNYWTMILITTFVVAIVFFVFPKNIEKNTKFELSTEEQEILACIENENYAKAIEIYKKNQHIDYNNFLWESIMRCYLKVRKTGIEAIHNNNLNKARACLNIAIEAFPNDTETISYLAITYLPVDTEYAEAFPIGENKEDIKKAKNYLLKCIEIDPYESKYFLLFGKIEFSLGNYPEAAQNLQKAFELDEKNIEALNLLYKIPCESPNLQRQCYQYLFNVIDSLAKPKTLDLYSEYFKSIEKAHYENYLQYIAQKNIDNQKRWNEYLKKTDFSEYNSSLQETLLSFRHIDNFSKDLVNHIKNEKFLNEILESSKKLVQEEFRKYCIYQLVYMYNHKNWKLKFPEKEEHHFREKLQEIIENSEHNVFNKFLAIRAYIERYGFVYILKILTNNESLLNKIIITATMRQMGIPTTHSVFYSYQHISEIETDEKYFLDYLIASTFYIHINDFGKDTYGRTLENNVILVPERDKQILNNLRNSNDERTKITANISLLYLIDKQKDSLLFSEIEEYLIAQMPSNNPLIRRYIHFYFWSNDNIGFSPEKNKYGILYLKALDDEDDDVKKIVLVHHHFFSNYITKQNDKLLKLLANTDKKNNVFRLHLLLFLSYAAGMDYHDLKEHFKNLDPFEQTYAYLINLYANLLNRNNTLNNVSALKMLEERKKDVAQDPNPYTKCFNFYVFSLIRYHFLDKSASDDVLQTILYQLYRKPSFGTMLNIVFSETSENEKRKFARLYFEHDNENIRKYSKASYIAMLVNEKEREQFFEKAQISKNPKEKNVVALGFYLSLEKNILYTDYLELAKIFETLFNIKPSQEYHNYIEIMMILLKEDYQKNRDQFNLKKKWLEYACELDPQESKYYFERSLFSKLEGNKQQALNLLEKAIRQSKSTEIEQYLYYFEQAKLLEELGQNKKALESLDISTIKMQERFFLKKVAPIYLRLQNHKKAEEVYNKILLQGRTPQEIIENLGLVAVYITMQEKNTAITMFHYINEMYKRSYFLYTNKNINAITPEIFSIYEQIFPELKELREMGVFTK